MSYLCHINGNFVAFLIILGYTVTAYQQNMHTEVLHGNLS